MRVYSRLFYIQIPRPGRGGCTMAERTRESCGSGAYPEEWTDKICLTIRRNKRSSLRSGAYLLPMKAISAPSMNTVRNYHSANTQVCLRSPRGCVLSVCQVASRTLGNKAQWEFPLTGSAEGRIR